MHDPVPGTESDLLSERLSKQDDGARRLRNAPLRLDRHGELHRMPGSAGELAELNHARAGAGVEDAGGKGLVLHEDPELVALLDGKGRQPVDVEERVLLLGMEEELCL